MKVSIYSGSRDAPLIMEKQIEFENSLKLILSEFTKTQKNVDFYTGGASSGIMKMIGKVLFEIKNENSTMIAIKPTQWMNDDDNFSHQVIETKTIQERKELLTQADMILAFPGGIGTFDEIFDTLATTEKDVLLFDPYGQMNLMLDLIEKSVEDGYTSAKVIKRLKVFQSPLEMKMHMRAEISLFNYARRIPKKH